MILDRKESVEVPVRPSWVGKGTSGLSGSSDELRQAMVAAQNAVLDLFDLSSLPSRWTVWWMIRMKGGNAEYEWNPQVGVPEGADCLVCYGGVKS
jgi:hypothetical protein